MNESSGAFRIAVSLALFALVGPFIRTINLPIAVLLFYSGFFATLIIFVYLIAKGRAKECFPNTIFRDGYKDLQTYEEIIEKVS